MKKILLAVTGMSPQIVTETLYALVTQQGFIPDEIHIITTVHGRNKIELNLLKPESGYFHRFCREYGLVGRIKFDLSQVKVIEDANGVPLPDIRTPLENEAAANQILSYVHNLCDDEDSCLHVSIAGGRKSMGFYLGYALSLFARPQDTASHVLVNAPFENLTGFYYPPKENESLSLPDGQIVQTQDAEVMLAAVPLVKLRAGLPKETLLRKGELTYSEAVKTAQANIVPNIKLVLGSYKSKSVQIIRDGDKRTIKLPDAEFALIYVMAEYRVANRPFDPKSTQSFKDYHNTYSQILPLDSSKLERFEKSMGIDKNNAEKSVPVSTLNERAPLEFAAFFSQKKSKIWNTFYAEIDASAENCQIVSRGIKPQTNYELNILPKFISFK